MLWIFILGVAFISLIFAMTLVLTGCDNKNKKVTMTPFTTGEWKECFEECKVSMPKNLSHVEFSDSEIRSMNVDSLCVQFCTKALYEKRGIKL